MNQNLKFETLIRLYFGGLESIKAITIKRAYRDFSRTIAFKNDNKSKRQIAKNKIEKLLEAELSKLLTKKFKNQTEFDLFHRNLTEKIKSSWTKLTYGQIQKWINMTLKYWLIVGENHIQGIETNYKFFHIPIDRIVRERVFSENSSNKPWSKIETYDEYYFYQLKLREKINKQIPIDFEAAIYIKN